MSDTGTEGHGVRRFFGGLLMAVGFLMAALCGLCTVVFVISGLTEGRGELFSGGDIAIMALFIGGLPTLIGVGLVAGGRALWKPPPPRRPPPLTMSGPDDRP